VKLPRKLIDDLKATAGGVAVAWPDLDGSLVTWYPMPENTSIAGIYG